LLRHKLRRGCVASASAELMRPASIIPDQRPERYCSPASQILATWHSGGGVRTPPEALQGSAQVKLQHVLGFRPDHTADLQSSLL
jgi:hypothetical protein